MEDIDYIIRSRIGDILIECRKEKGLTQAELAKEIGSNPTTVATWEQKKSMPSVNQLYRLAKYFGKTISYMYGEEGPHEHRKAWENLSGPRDKERQDIHGQPGSQTDQG